MTCFHPLQGYRSRSLSAKGKRTWVFNRKDGWADMPMTIPCGNCTGCKLERSRQWAVRCMHEASLHEDNCFITLTYAPEHMPPAGSLDKKAFPKFMKRLRRRIGKVRYFHCGEYGEATQRPHYHALLFGYAFPDKTPWSERQGFPVWRSKLLEQTWKKGNSEIGTLTFKSAAYVARYIIKKARIDSGAYEVCDLPTGELIDKEREYTTMSRNPGIGKGWWDKYKSEVFPSDQVIMEGRPQKPPRYYDNQHQIEKPTEAAMVQRRRGDARRLEDETTERLHVRELCLEKRLNLFPREVTE